MRPDLLVWIELRRVRRKEGQLQLASLALDVHAHQLVLVHGVAIEHNEDRIRRAHHQALQEGFEDRGCDGSVVQHKAELSLGADGRQHVEREAPARGCHHGRLSRRCSGRSRLIVRRNACLIGKEDRRAQFTGLLLDRGDPPASAPVRGPAARLGRGTSAM